MTVWIFYLFLNFSQVTPLEIHISHALFTRFPKKKSIEKSKHLRKAQYKNRLDFTLNLKDFNGS